MSDNYSPNLFLFQSYITEVLKEGKKHIKTAPFDAIDPDSTLFTMQLSLSVTSSSISISIISTSFPQWGISKQEKLLAQTIKNC
jgi:hypothetical protein